MGMKSCSGMDISPLSHYLQMFLSALSHDFYRSNMEEQRVGDKGPEQRVRGRRQGHAGAIVSRGSPGYSRNPFVSHVPDRKSNFSFVHYYMRSQKECAREAI